MPIDRRNFATTTAALIIFGALQPSSASVAPRSPFDPPPAFAKAAPSKPKAAKIPRSIEAAPAFPGEDADAAEPPQILLAAPAPKAAKPAAKRSKGRLPASYLGARVDRLWADVKSRPLRQPTAAPIAAHAEANKQSWLNEAYARNVVDASQIGFFLADKLMVAEIFKREMGAEADRYYPKTIGLKQFLERNKLVDSEGALTAEPDAVEQALADEFPYGFIVRPAVGVAPKETEHGLFAKSDQLVAELFDPASAVYSASSYRRPIKSHILEGVASGEAVVIQEDVVLRADARKRLRSRAVAHARVHTYEGRVVPGAAPERWSYDDGLTDDRERRAEAFVSEMLGKLSAQLLARQAWSVDVAIFDNGDLRVMDVVTNRGRRVAWSSYLEQPRVIGAYSRLWEERCGIVFEGLSGALLRRNLANYFPFWGRRIENAKAPWKKALALLPPMP